ncbi:hypothetical protein FQZ97_631920 [compost metagenome]
MQHGFAVGDVVQDENVPIARRRRRFHDFVRAFAASVDIGVGTVAADQHVVPGSTFDDVVPEATGDHIGVVAAHQDVGTLAADERVTPGAAKQSIVAIATVETVVATIAEQRVVAAETIDRIISIGTGEHVTGLGAVDDLAAFETRLQINDREIVEGKTGIAPGIKAEGAGIEPTVADRIGKQRLVVEECGDLVTDHFDPELHRLSRLVLARNLCEDFLNTVLHTDEVEDAAGAIARVAVKNAVSVELELVVVLVVLVAEQEAEAVLVRRLDRRLDRIVGPGKGRRILEQRIGAETQHIDAVAERAPAALPVVGSGGT